MLLALFESSDQSAENYGAIYQHGQLLEQGRHIETPHLYIYRISQQDG